MKNNEAAAVNVRYQIALILLLLLFLLLAFFPFARSPNPAAIQKTMDAGHVFAFFMLSSLFYMMFEPRGVKRAVLVSALLSISVMAAIELLQPYVGRTASWVDLEVGLLGGFIALSGMVIWRCMNSRMLRLFHLLLAMTTIVWLTKPALDEWRALWLREQSFPMIGDFEHALAKRLWKASGVANGVYTKASLSDEFVASGNGSLKIETVSGTWSGVSYSAGDQDWRGYEFLTLMLHNPGPPFVLHLRIDDGSIVSPTYKQRYNGHFLMQAGSNSVVIALARIESSPAERALDLSRIRTMVFFTNKKERSRVFYLDDVQLVP